MPQQPRLVGMTSSVTVTLFFVSDFLQKGLTPIIAKIDTKYEYSTVVYIRRKIKLHTPSHERMSYADFIDNGESANYCIYPLTMYPLTIYPLTIYPLTVYPLGRTIVLSGASMEIYHGDLLPDTAIFVRVRVFGNMYLDDVAFSQSRHFILCAP